MKSLFSALCGFGLLVLFVIQPLRANLIASLATTSGLDSIAQARLLESAASSDPCNTNILDRAGNAWFLVANYHMAAYAYGRAMICSPASSAPRFKYAEALLAIGSPSGISSLRDSLTLEPNNPTYQNEWKRITGFK